MTYLEQLADFFTGLRYDALPPDVLHKTRLHLLDALGLAIAGSNADWTRTTLEAAKSLGGPGESRVVGSQHMLPAPNAALANGTAIHGLDYDDTYIPGQLHSCCFVVSAALAVAEACGAGGKETLAAIAGGFEFAVRTARASFNEATGRSRFTEKGLHNAGILGALGSAAIASKLMGMKGDQMADAVGIAASQASGILQAQLEGNQVKALHPGWGAHSGIIAARLAQGGFSGPHAVFEGEFGIFATMLGEGNYDNTLMVDAIGKRWELLNISFKLYPAGQGTHFFLESALRLQREHNIKPADMAQVVCMVTSFRVSAHFEPHDLRYTPTNDYIARFSLPYLLSVRLLKDDVGLDAFSEESLHDPEILGLAAKVSYVLDEDADLPQNKGHVIIRTRDGREYEGKQTVIPGTPELPATREQVESKFRSNARRVLPEKRVEAIIQAVNNLEQLGNVRELMDLTAP